MASERPFWRESLAPYEGPSFARSILQIGSSVAPFAALAVLMYLALDVSYLLTLALALALPASGFLVRTYIVFHDCAHGSFLPSKRNAWLGTGLGLLLFACYAAWRHNHAVHHATAGDLDRRGVGDVATESVAEYRALTPRERYRNRLVMFGLGPFIGMIVQARFVPKNARPRIRRANVALAGVVASLCAVIVWQEYLLVQLPLVVFAGGTGIWLFYGQHQFEDGLLGDGGAVELRRCRAARQLLPQAAQAAAVLHRQHRAAPRPPPQRADPELQPAARARRQPDLPRRATLTLADACAPCA